MEDNAVQFNALQNEVKGKVKSPYPGEYGDLFATDISNGAPRTQQFHVVQAELLDGQQVVRLHENLQDVINQLWCTLTEFEKNQTSATLDKIVGLYCQVFNVEDLQLDGVQVKIGIKIDVSEICEALRLLIAYWNLYCIDQSHLEGVRNYLSLLRLCTLDGSYSMPFGTDNIFSRLDKKRKREEEQQQLQQQWQQQPQNASPRAAFANDEALPGGHVFSARKTKAGKWVSMILSNFQNGVLVEVWKRTVTADPTKQKRTKIVEVTITAEPSTCLLPIKATKKQVCLYEFVVNGQVLCYSLPFIVVSHTTAQHRPALIELLKYIHRANEQICDAAEVRRNLKAITAFLNFSEGEENFCAMPPLPDLHRSALRCCDLYLLVDYSIMVKDILRIFRNYFDFHSNSPQLDLALFHGVLTKDAARDKLWSLEPETCLIRISFDGLVVTYFDHQIQEIRNVLVFDPRLHKQDIRIFIKTLRADCFWIKKLLCADGTVLDFQLLWKVVEKALPPLTGFAEMRMSLQQGDYVPDLPFYL